MAGLARFRAKIERICSAPADSRTLRLHVLEELRGVIPFDAYVWLVTDPDTAVGAAPLADVPCLPELPRLITLKYLSVVNRWTTLASQDPPVGLLMSTTKGERTQSLVWRELLCRYDIEDIASTVFADRFGCWGFLDLWRAGAGATFDEDDATLLAAIAPSVTQALRECQARTFVSPAVSHRRELGPAVLLLDDELTVTGQTAATQSWLRVLVPAPEGHTPIPASVYNVAAQLLAVEHDVDRHRPAARVHLADGFWVTLRAARLSQPGSEAGSIAVTIEETSPVDRLEVFSRAAALTAREAELLGHLARGSDTRDLAERMFLSEHTVQDHLKSIFAKTSAHSRRTLLSRALGTQP